MNVEWEIEETVLEGENGRRTKRAGHVYAMSAPNGIIRDWRTSIRRCLVLMGEECRQNVRIFPPLSDER
jgi:hypothetical protein